MKTKLLFLLKTNTFLHFLLSGIYILFLQVVMKNPLSLCEGGFPLLGSTSYDSLDENIIKFIEHTGYSCGKVPSDAPLNITATDSVKMDREQVMFLDVMRAIENSIIKNKSSNNVELITKILQEKNDQWSFYPKDILELQDIESPISRLIIHTTMHFIINNNQNAFDLLTVLHFEVNNRFIDLPPISYETARMTAMDMTNAFMEEMQANNLT